MFKRIPDPPKQRPSLYETDFAEWINVTVQNLRERRFAELDLNNLIEEIESLGKRDKRELQSRLIVLLLHLLKYTYQPEKRSNSWIATIAEQRRQIFLILQDSPSLKNYLAHSFENCYTIARKDAVRETQLAIETFPEICSFTLEKVLDDDWFPAD